MAPRVIPTAAAARAAANVWLITQLPERFAAGIPDYDVTRDGWRIPVWLSYPALEPHGPVGELLVDAVSGDGQAHTPIIPSRHDLTRGRDRHTIGPHDPMDSQLPGMDGYEATRRIKADPALHHIPIIAVTPYALLCPRRATTCPKEARLRTLSQPS